MKLYSNSDERELIEQQADIYAIVTCIEHLEKAYIRDSLSAAEYAPTTKTSI